MNGDKQDTLHASSVSLNGRGVLILGDSGSGKSTLALDLMSRGATLISDDRTQIKLKESAIFADAPPAIRGQIEARGIGILAAENAGPTLIVLVVELGAALPETVTARLPDVQTRTILDVEIELIYGTGRPNLGAAILQFLKGGRVA